MKRLILALLILSLIGVLPVWAADYDFVPGVYQFEDYLDGFTLWDVVQNGTWDTHSILDEIVYRRTTVTGSWLYLGQLYGDTMIIYRSYFDTAAFGVTDVCFDGGFTDCLTFSNGDTSLAGDEFQSPIFIPITGKSFVYIYNRSAATIWLDYFEIVKGGPWFDRHITATWTPPVATATILPSSTAGVATATILPSSTPGVPTATVVPTATPPNTPVDTATAAPTATEITFPATPTEVDIGPILTLIAGLTPSTPVPTLTPTETLTPTAAPWVYITVTSGQLTRFDYVATASDVHIANLLLLIFVSVWGFFLFAIFIWRYKK